MICPDLDFGWITAVGNVTVREPLFKTDQHYRCGVAQFLLIVLFPQLSVEEKVCLLSIFGICSFYYNYKKNDRVRAKRDSFFERLFERNPSTRTGSLKRATNPTSSVAYVTVFWLHGTGLNCGLSSTC